MDLDSKRSLGGKSNKYYLSRLPIRNRHYRLPYIFWLNVLTIEPTETVYTWKKSLNLNNMCAYFVSYCSMPVTTVIEFVWVLLPNCVCVTGAIVCYSDSRPKYFTSFKSFICCHMGMVMQVATIIVTLHWKNVLSQPKQQGS